jgi:hypothetical protein
MHGQSFNDLSGTGGGAEVGGLRLWWGKADDRPDRPRNLFGLFTERPSAALMFRGGGCISEEGLVDRGKLVRLMTKLAVRIGAENEEPGGRPDNSRIPSGYTYLLQFIAHDMVDSVVSFSIDKDVLCPGSRNARPAPLLLDTLYGGGPDECPQAYEFRAANSTGNIPRMYLRVGPPDPLRPPAGLCPFRDIARSAPNSMDEGQPTPSPHDPCEPVRRYFTEAMIADPRNDAHALISQLTVLFHLFHNHILREIEDVTRRPGAEPGKKRELAYRQFTYARFIVTLIYRNIIEKDVLEKILDADIYKSYVINGRLLNDSGESIPLEFTFGAFRFGHSMVRDSYTTLADNERPADEALLLSSQQAPHLLPVSADWFLDWARFFYIEQSEPHERIIRPNLSKAIGPYYPAFLERPKSAEPIGLPFRDLLSASYAGMLSVPALCQFMRDKGFRKVRDFAEWRKDLEEWLIKPPHSAFKAGDPDTRAIANDPPLPFFVLFEAANTNDETNETTKDKPRGGQRLGPLGSIIVAETILGAMRRYRLGVEEAGLAQRASVDNFGRLLFPEVGDALSLRLSDVADIGAMSNLLDYMRRNRAYG